MAQTSVITSEEYQMIREEIATNIKQQDEISNTIFIVLGLSMVFNNWIENVIFLTSVLLFSSVLLSKIIHCRNSVYYLSSYLLTNKALEYCQWERNITLFKKTAYCSDKNSGFIRFVFHCAFIMRNLGNLIFSFFIFTQIVSIIFQSCSFNWVKITLLIISFLALGLNVIFTIVICVDRKLKEQYKEIWDKIINGKEK